MKPHVDIQTGKIFGCQEGSFAWWHEKGHIEFNSNPKTSWLLMMKSYFFDAWMFFVTCTFVYKPFLYIVVALMGSYVLLTVFEEHWCNKYAERNFILK